MDTIFWTDPAVWILALAALGGFFMAFNNGANDVSNAFASAVGSQAIGMRKALFLAGIFTVIGAVFFGGKVAVKLVEGLVQVTQFDDPLDYGLAMVSVLFSAGIFILISTGLGLPVSCTHSIVGSFTGMNVAVIGWDAIEWGVLGWIALSWVLSPILAGAFSWSLLWLIESKWQPLKKRRFFKVLYAFIAFLLALGSFFVLDHFSWQWSVGLDRLDKLQLAFIVGLIAYALLAISYRFQVQRPTKNQAFERLQVGTACAVAFGNGANDVSNSISPLLAVYWVLCSGGFPGSADAAVIPNWILWVGGSGILCGILLLGHRVMETLGRKITVLTPDKGFGIDLSVAIVVISASALGLPISTTHAATGSIIGGGLRNGIRNLSLSVLAKIFIAWIFTVPMAAVLTIGVYKLLGFVLL